MSACLIEDITCTYIDTLFAGDLSYETGFFDQNPKAHKLNGCWVDWEHKTIDELPIQQIDANLAAYQQLFFLYKVYAWLRYFITNGKSIHRHYETLVLFRLIANLPSLIDQSAMPELAITPNLPADLASACSQFGWFSRMKQLMQVLIYYVQASALVELCRLKPDEGIVDDNSTHADTPYEIVTTSYETKPEPNPSYANETARDFTNQLQALKQFVCEKKEKASQIKSGLKKNWIEEAYKEFNVKFNRIALKVHPDKNASHGLSALESHDLMQQLNQLKATVLTELTEACEVDSFEELLATLQEQSKELHQKMAVLKQKLQHLKKLGVMQDKVITRQRTESAKDKAALAAKDDQIAALKRQLSQANNPQGLFQNSAARQGESLAPQQGSCVIS